MWIIVVLVIAFFIIGIYASLTSEPELPEWKKREVAVKEEEEQIKTDGAIFCNSIVSNPAVVALADSVYEVIKAAISRSIDASLTNHVHYGSDTPLDNLRLRFSLIDISIYCSYLRDRDRGWTLRDFAKDVDVLDHGVLFRYSEFNIQALDTEHKKYGLALAVAKLVNPKLQKLHLPNATKISASVYAEFHFFYDGYEYKPFVEMQLAWDAYQNKYTEL